MDKRWKRVVLSIQQKLDYSEVKKKDKVQGHSSEYLIGYTTVLKLTYQRDKFLKFAYLSGSFAAK